MPESILKALENWQSYDILGRHQARDEQDARDKRSGPSELSRYLQEPPFRIPRLSRSSRNTREDFDGMPEELHITTRGGVDVHIIGVPELAEDERRFCSERDQFMIERAYTAGYLDGIEAARKQIEDLFGTIAAAAFMRDHVSVAGKL